MSQLSFRQLWNALSTGTLIAVGLLLAGLNGPVRAGPIFDPLGDFLPTYTGAQDAGLDVLAHEVTLVGDRLNFFGRMAGPIAPTQAVGGLYLIGVDRGLGTPRFLNSPAAPPTIGPNVKWDAIVRILPDGTGFYLNSLLGVTTPLSTSDISIIGNEFNVSIPVSLMLLSATKPPEEWTYNLWPRNGVGLNVQVSDLAPDDGNSPVHAVPEPVSLTACGIGALGLLGCRWRRRRHTARKLGTRRQRKKNPVAKHPMALVTATLATVLAIFARTPVARADIFQWEYINPANPGEGKQPSAILTPDGTGVIAAPGADLSYRNLTLAYLIGADLTGAYAREANLNNAELSQANLANAILSFATLTNANLTGAEVRGANFTRDQFSQIGSGISISQLYSTASYVAHDLTGIGLGHNNLAGVNLAGQNLTNASFTSATLTNANFSQANLTNASLAGATLTSANLNGAEVRGADFVETTSRGFTAAQLYSTASYQAHDLTGIGLSGNSLSGVNLAGQNLTNASFTLATLTNANFSQANLTNASFTYATLTGANLTGAEVRGANFVNFGGTGITMSQLYSTASYQAHDLTGIDLTYINLSGGNLAGQNLTGADFYGATLANANLSQANLTGASFYGATLTGANFTNAEVRGATFYNSLFSAAQLYSTASYQAHDLSGIGLESNNLAGANLAGQNLTNASLGSANLANANLSQANLTGADFFHCDYYCGAAYLAGANLSQANLTNANFSGSTYPIYDEYGEIIGTGVTPGADLTNANLSGADARGATFEYASVDLANAHNLILPNGHIYSLDLTAGASLVVRDYDGNPAVPTIVVDQHLAMDATGTLRLVFDADSWDSTISFAPGIPVALGGTLELTFAPDVNLAGQIGRTIDLFDWTGVAPTGTFSVSSPYTWNVSNLYTTGEVTLTAAPGIVPGDFNGNGTVDAADYIVWRKSDGTPAGYNAWRTHFGQPSGTGSAAAANATVPEPTAPAKLLTGLVLWMFFRRRPEYYQA